MEKMIKILWLLLDPQGFCKSTYTKKELDDMGIKFD